MIEPRNPTPWDDVFMEMCKVIAKRSKDPNTQVGAVIVDSLNRIVSVGFNGPPKNIVDTMFSWERPEKYGYIKHAEDNALWFGSLARGWDGLRGVCLYVSAAPCPSCMLSIIRAEIGVVIFDSTQLPSMLSGPNAGEWDKTKHLAKLAGVELKEFRSGATPVPEAGTGVAPASDTLREIGRSFNDAFASASAHVASMFTNINEEIKQEEPKSDEIKEQEKFLKDGIIGSKWG